MKFYQVVHPDLFKPLTSKYKETFLDCLLIIYKTYRNEMSFGVDREVVVAEIERYYEMASVGDMIFDDEEEEVISDARSQATMTIRKLKECGWIEYEQGHDYSVRINMFDYASTMLDTFEKIIRDDEMEYQSIISQIYGTLLNQEAYVKPYEYIIKRVIQNTEELMKGLKKLNTNIKKYIEAITVNKTAGEIVEDFFVYHKEIGSKAYHRIKTSDNISYFRATIQEKLYEIMEDEEIFNRAIDGYMVIEDESTREVAEQNLRDMVLGSITAFNRYDDIISEIDEKNSRYIASAVARAKFLLNNMNNMEGKIIRILNHVADEMNALDELSLNDEADEQLLQMISLFPQYFLDGESLYIMPIKNKSGPPEELSDLGGMSQEERTLRKEAQRLRDERRFSRKNINNYILNTFEKQERTAMLASELPLESKRDLIRMIFISLYGRDPKAGYVVKSTGEIKDVLTYKFQDFWIEKEL